MLRFIKKYFLILGFFLGVVFTSLSMASGETLPELGASERKWFSESEEKKMRDEFLRVIRDSTKPVHDPLVQNYIEELGYALVSKIPSKGGDLLRDRFTFFMIEDRTINAVSGPSGYIGIHSGLLLETSTEHEMASVLAHEMAHYSQRHIGRMVESAQRLSIPTLAALLASMALATQNQEAGTAAMASTLGSRVQWELNRSREYEKEADRVGMQILESGGFDPLSMPKFFERLQAANRFNTTQLPAFLSTHPVTEDRIADAMGRALKYPRKSYDSHLAYYLAQARLRVLTDPDEKSLLTTFKEKSVETHASIPNLAAAHQYGYALALLKSHQIPLARQWGERLFRKDPTNRFYRILLAEIEQKEGHAVMAARLLKEGLLLFPTDYALTLEYVGALLGAGEPKTAQEALQSYMRNVRPNDPYLLTRYSEVQGKLGDTVGVLQSRAEILYWYGDLKPAIEQLEYALKIPGIHATLTAQIQAKIDLWKGLLKDA
ncbi:MAG: M48 family metallopeptidase [Gammaproteobacteria bacterium]|nr:M48 family metallopeptidase [Gammaproteobacteria bacterium]